jgi:tripartite-type tricarboxylate transporter receptor subunit TctC
MKRTTSIAAALVLALTATSAFAQSWPDGSVQLVIPSRPGGGTDVMGRIFGDYLQGAIGAPIAVINQPTGGGSVAHEQVRTAAPDGQTLLFQHTGLLINYHTGKYDHSYKDFTVLGIGQAYPPQVFAVSPDAPWQNMRDFVEDARSKPGQLTVGVSLGGGSHFIAGELMMNEDIELRLVEASAEVDKVAGIQGGHIHIGNLGAGAAHQFEEAGQMRVLCMIDPTPDLDYPEYQTCLEQGVKVSYITALIVWGPPGIAPEVAEKINAAIMKMGDDPVALERLGAADSAFKPYNLQEAQQLVASEDEKFGALARHLGLSAR